MPILFPLLAGVREYLRPSVHLFGDFTIGITLTAGYRTYVLAESPECGCAGAVSRPDYLLGGLASTCYLYWSPC